MRNIKQNRGITLIALIITVIVMLIIAGVALSTINGENGLFGRTQKTAELYNNQTKDEKSEFDKFKNALNGDYSNGNEEETIPPAEDNITITVSPITPAQEVTVVMKTNIEKYAIEYKEENGDWTRYTYGEEGFETATNGTILARFVNGAGKEGETKSITINNIDTKAPEEFDLNTESTTKSITVSGSTTDLGIEGTAEENIGIRGYQYKLTNSAGTAITDWTEETEETSYTFNTGITQGTTYKVNMRAVDKAGNIREATNKETTATLHVHTDDCYSWDVSYGYWQLMRRC